MQIILKDAAKSDDVVFNVSQIVYILTQMRYDYVRIRQ